MNLTLVVTHQCNLSCHYCYAGEKENRRMSWETARAAIELAMASSDPRLDLAFFGGEPLLEWDLLVRASGYARRRAAEAGKRLRLMVTTNGTRLTDERLAWLAEMDFFLGLSMDGNVASQDAGRRFRSGRSSFEAVARALDRVLATPGLHYEVVMVVDPENAPHLSDSVDFLLDRGVNRLSFNPNFFTPWDDEARAGWEAGYRRAAVRFLTAYRCDRPVWVNFLDSKIITAVKGGYAAGDTCQFGEKELAVTPSGNVFPCERLVGDDRDPTWVMGNVHTGLEPRLVCKASQGCGNAEDECRTCPLTERCMNWCGCTNYLETGASDRVGGNLCWHEKMSIPIADEVARTLYSEENAAFLRTFYFEAAPEAKPTSLPRMAV